MPLSGTNAPSSERLSKSTSRKTFEPLMSNSELQGHRLLLSGAHWFVFQNAKIFPVQMVAWGLMLSVSSGCEIKTLRELHSVLLTHSVTRSWTHLDELRWN